MRERKFKLWNKREKKWYKCDPVNDAYIGLEGGIYIGDKDFCIRFQYNDDFELVEYTGLRDINGKEIFDGDIVKANLHPTLEENNILHEVKFTKYGDDEAYSTKYHYGWYAGHSLADMEGICEVVGNVHENPELLKI